MRLIFGMILGIALTLGAAFYHDNNLPPQTPATALAERPIVNWEVLGAVAKGTVDAAKGLLGGNRR
jgi:hypothetical protein